MEGNRFQSCYHAVSRLFLPAEVGSKAVDVRAADRGGFKERKSEGREERRYLGRRWRREH